MSHLNYFISEMDFEGKMPITQTNMRAAETWIKWLDAYHINIFKALTEEKNMVEHVG